MVEKKKGFFSKLIDGFDKKLEKKSKEKSCSCCQSCNDNLDADDDEC